MAQRVMLSEMVSANQVNWEIKTPAEAMSAFNNVRRNKKSSDVAKRDAANAMLTIYRDTRPVTQSVSWWS